MSADGMITAISALNAYPSYVHHKQQFVSSLRDLNREFCRLARAEGISCRRCRCSRSHTAEEGDVNMEALDEGEFVLVVDAGQGAREVLVRERNLEAEVAALDFECDGGEGMEREVVFSADEDGDEEEEGRPLLSGPVSQSRA